MDKPQPLPLLELTEIQVDYLMQEELRLTRVLSDMQFNDPPSDDLKIRQHAALAGERSAIQKLLMHDVNLTTAVEEEARETLDAETTTYPQPTTESF